LKKLHVAFQVVAPFQTRWVHLFSPAMAPDWRKRVFAAKEIRRPVGAVFKSVPTAETATVSPPAMTVTMPTAPVDVLRRRRLLGKQFERVHVATDGGRIREPRSQNHRCGGRWPHPT
jgi:hypothetical protein